MKYELLNQAFNAISTITDEDWQMLEPGLRIQNFSKEENYLSAGQIEQRIGFITKGSFRWYYIDEKGVTIK
jgi:hypothetical protein